MIKSIHIQNFQSHLDSSITLSPGVNLICGSSDSGKSAIIRALKWLATNRPLGDGFVSWGSKKETIVEIHTTEEWKIKHSPGRYLLEAGKLNQEWSAIGTTVPEAVTQALNLSELSWQSQMDPPFLLSASPGEVARTLNEVADLDKIDSTLVNINRIARDNRTQLTETARAKQQFEIDLSAFRELDNQLAEIVRLKEIERKAGLLEDMVGKGESVRTEIAHVRVQLIRYENVEKNLTLVRQLNERMTEYENVGEGVGKGQRMLSEIKELTDRLKVIKDPTDAEAELDLLLDMVGQAKKLDKDIDNLFRQIEGVENTSASLKTQTTVLSKMEETWHDRFPSVCPLCGRGNK